MECLKANYEGVEVTYPLDMELSEAIDYVGEELTINPKLNLIKMVITLSEDKTVVNLEPVYDTIGRVRRITGYLSNKNNFNDAKKAEASDRVAHIST